MDKFEVVFVGGATGNEIARASWVIGESVSIKDVPGTNDPFGYNYNSLSATGPFSIPTTSAEGTGSAVLYAGRKDNGTLLAVGVITKIDGVAVDIFDSVPEKAIINANSKNVTFGLAALEGKIPVSFAISGSGITLNTNYRWLDAKYSTYTIPALTFLPDYAATNPATATYTIISSSSSLTFARIFASFVIGTNSVTSKAPRFELPSGNFVELKGAPAEIVPTQTTALAGSGGIVFSIERGSKQGLAAFSFSIPVSALTNASGFNSIPAEEWFIVPGYKNNYLDDGGPGGSILIYIADPLKNTLNFNELGIIVSGP